MKTSEDKTNALPCCQVDEIACHDCKYFGKPYCSSAALKDALEKISKLEDTIGQMILQMRGDCGVCKHRHEQRKTPFDIVKGEFSIPIACDSCMTKDNHPNWEYEGLPK